MCIMFFKRLSLFGSILGRFWVSFGSVLGQFWVSFGSVFGDVRLISGQLSTFWFTFDLFLG